MAVMRSPVVSRYDESIAEVENQVTLQVWGYKY